MKKTLLQAIGCFLILFSPLMVTASASDHTDSRQPNRVLSFSTLKATGGQVKAYRLVRPEELNYSGSAIVPMMSEGLLIHYKRTGYSKGRIGWGNCKLWITSHAYSYYIHAFKLPDILTQEKGWTETGHCRPIGSWLSPTGKRTKSLLAQIPSPTAKQMGQPIFLKNGRWVTPVFDTYNVAGRNDPCFAIREPDGSVRGLFKVVGKYANSHRVAEYGSAFGNYMIVGAQGMAGQGSGSWGPAAYLIEDLESKGSLQAICLLFYPRGTIEDLLPNPASNWNGMVLIGNTLIFIGNIALGRESTDWGYGKPPVDACSQAKGYWAKSYKKILAFYDLKQLITNRNKPWQNRPYATLDISKVFWRFGGRCGTAGGMIYDGSRLIICEPGATRRPKAYESNPVVHVYNLIYP